MVDFVKAFASGATIPVMMHCIYSGLQRSNAWFRLASTIAGLVRLIPGLPCITMDEHRHRFPVITGNDGYNEFARARIHPQADDVPYFVLVFEIDRGATFMGDLNIAKVTHPSWLVIVDFGRMWYNDCVFVRR